MDVVGEADVDHDPDNEQPKAGFKSRRMSNPNEFLTCEILGS